MKTINLFELVGDFGEDKDVAASIRDTQIVPSVSKRERIALDFEGVTLVTQSFIHALISSPLRVNGEDVLDLIDFVNCSEPIRGIIATVVQYSLDTADG